MQIGLLITETNHMKILFLRSLKHENIISTLCLQIPTEHNWPN